MKKKSMNYKTYLRKFKKISKNGILTTSVFDSDGKELKPNKNEVFRQCYNPHVPGCNELPKYWFHSNKGNVISVNGKEPLWLLFTLDQKTGRESRKFDAQNGKSHTLTNYQLTALVFSDETAPNYGKAASLLETKGLDAIDRNDNIYGVDIHHETMFDKNKPRSYNCKPQHLACRTKQVHRIFDKKTPDECKTDAERMGWWKYVAQVTADEEPNRSSLIIKSNRPGEPRKEIIRALDKPISSTGKPQWFVRHEPLTDNIECKEHWAENQTQLTNLFAQIFKDNGYSKLCATIQQTSKEGTTYQVYGELIYGTIEATDNANVLFFQSPYSGTHKITLPIK